MIEANHNKITRFFYEIIIYRMMKKNFTDFYLVNDLPHIPNDKNLIVTPNHISWWDGFFVEYLFHHKINRKIFILMLEEQLKKYKLFAQLGAFSITPGKLNSLKETSLYIGNNINPENYFVIYPQGKIEPFEKEPLSVKPGLKFFLNNNKNETLVLPVAFKIQYDNKKFPFIAVRFGEPLDADSVVTDWQEYVNQFHRNISELNRSIFNKLYKYEKLF